MPRPILPQPPTINTTQPVGLWRQIFLALSFMLGPGVFVGIGLAIAVAGIGSIGAISLAALLALVNQTGSNQPSANSAGEDLSIRTDWQYFLATWSLFLSRLTAVATAALGIAGYLLASFRLSDPILLMLMALVVVALTIATRGQTSSRFARMTTLLAIVALLGLVLVGLPKAAPLNWQALSLLSLGSEGASSSWSFVANLLQAVALMSVAYAGNETQSASWRGNTRYLQAQKLATFLAWLLYLGVAIVSFSIVGLWLTTAPDRTPAVSLAPLSEVMQILAFPGGNFLITLGAVAGMIGMVLHFLPKLVDGLLELNQNPVVLATGCPPRIGLSPWLAKLLIGIAIGYIVLVGDVKTIWSFSAFAFLLYAALMHWIAIQDSARRLPQSTQQSQTVHQALWRHRIGLATCLFLAFWLNWDVWLVSLGLAALVLIWRGVQYWSEDP
jgi:APA family basic amino acid/polyamine antiporter